MRGPQLVQQRGLGVARGGGNHAGTQHAGKLQRKQGDPAGALGQHHIAGAYRVTAMQRVPGRERGAGQGSAFTVTQVCGQAYQVFRADCLVLAHPAIQLGAVLPAGTAGRKAAAKPAGEKGAAHAVASNKAANLATGFQHLCRGVGQLDQAILSWQRVPAL